MNIKKLFLGLLVLLLIGVGATAYWVLKPLDKVNSTAKPIQHDLWDTLLKKHVSTAGKVNYLAFKQDSLLLKEYLKLLSAHHPNDAFWSPEEQQAYWMNAYNAFTISLVLQHYPIKSIKDVTDVNIAFIKSPWDITFIEIEGHEYDLNNLEHNILRPQFKDPLIHVGVNCASVSCPNLPKEAFRADKLHVQLDSLMRLFLQDPTKNTITAQQLKLSKIFSWFKGDFTRKGSLIDFLNKYAPVTIEENATIEYNDYNWDLNDANNNITTEK